MIKNYPITLRGILSSFSLILISIFIFQVESFGQLSSKYTYSYTGTNTWAYNASPTILQTAGNVGANAVFANQAIGFTFQFNCVNYTTVGISGNGFIWFGTGACSATQYTPLSSTAGETGSVDGIISAFGANLASHTSGASPQRTLNVRLTGVAPNRVYTIEWRKAIVSGVNSNPFDAQIKLFETTNKIEIRLWDSPYFLSGSTVSGQVGIRATTTDFMNRSTTGFNLCTTIAGAANTATCSIVPTTSCNFAVSATAQAITFNYAFTGSCCTPPTTQASIGTFSAITTSSATVNWTNGNGAARVVVARQGGAVNASPANGTDYSVTQNSTFGSGANLGSGNYVVYQGTGNSVNVTGLTGGQTYHFAVFEYDTSPSICYLNPGSAASQLIPLCFPPTADASAFAASNVQTTSLDLSWVRGDGDAGVIVVGRATATAAVAPVAGTTYTTTTFGSGSGSQLTGAGNYVLYVGPGTGVSVSNLLPSTGYTFTVYEYNSAGVCYGSPISISQSTASCSPAVNATSLVFSNVLNTSLTLSFTRGSGTDVLVVARATATANVAPVYNTSYTANAAFGSGSTTGTGNFVVYNGTGNTVNITGLSATTSYTFLVYEYDASPNCYSTAPLSGAVTTLNPVTSGLALSCAYTGSSQSIALATITGNATRVTLATGAAIDDNLYPNQNIQSMTGGSGFLFSYLGTDYSSIGVSANGFIWLGTGQPGSTYASYGGTPVGSASANLGGSGVINGIIAAAGADLISHYHISAAPATSQINMVVTGTAPNRIVTIEWTGFQAKSIGNNSICWQLAYYDDSRLDFQIRLYEKGGTNSNRIEMVYGSQAPYCVFDAYSFQVGLRGASNTDFATRANTGSMTASSTTNGAAASTVITLNSSTFINGNVGVRYAPTLSAPVISGSLTNTCPSQTTTLSSTASTNYQWFLNGSLVPGPGSNTQNLSASQSGSYTVVVNASGCYMQSAPSVVSITPCGVNITASSGSNGSISPAGSTLVPAGNDQLFSFTPACGYAVSDVLIDGVSVGAMPSYTFTNVTIPHTIHVVFGIGAELCDNGIDDDCDTLIDEGCTANFPGDTPETSPLLSFSGNVTYPNCYPLSGDLSLGEDSPQSALFSGPDGWYSFVAQSTGVTITMYSTSMDNAIALYNKVGPNYILLDSENVNPAGVGGFERLTNNTLVPGVTYYVSVGASSGNAGSTYSLCIQHLMPGGCMYSIPPTGFGLCNNYKSIYRGSVAQGVTYDFHFTGVGGGASGTTSTTFTNGLIVLSNPTLNLRYGGIYDVAVDVRYSLANGAAVVEDALVLGSASFTNCSNVLIRTQPMVEVKNTQRCPAVLLRSNWLIGTQVGGDPQACGAINYTYEFTQISSCVDTTVVSAFPSEYTTAGATPYLSLGVLPSLANPGTWKVRIRPNFTYGPGVYGPAFRVTVSGTSASAVLPEEHIGEGEEKNLESSVEAALYPNPNDGQHVFVNYAANTPDGTKVRLIDALGTLVWEGYFAATDGVRQMVTFEKKLTAGVYLLEFRGGDDHTTLRMVVTD